MAEGEGPVKRIRRLRCIPIFDYVPWVGDSLSNECQECRAPFGIVVRRHHCRVCGMLLCGKCSTNRTHVPSSIGTTIGPYRTCSKCHGSIMDFSTRLRCWREVVKRRNSKSIGGYPSSEQTNFSGFFQKISGMFGKSPPRNNFKRYHFLSESKNVLQKQKDSKGLSPPVLPNRTPSDPLSRRISRAKGRLSRSSTVMSPTTSQYNSPVVFTRRSAADVPPLRLRACTDRKKVNEHPQPNTESSLHRSNSMPSLGKMIRRNKFGDTKRKMLRMFSHSQWDRLWRLAMSDWARNSYHRSKLASFWIWKGLTPSGIYRAQFWEIASGAKAKRIENQGLYASLVDKARELTRKDSKVKISRALQQAMCKIQRDVPRSMPSQEYKRFFITDKKVEPILRNLSACPRDFSVKIKLVSADLESLNNILLAYAVYGKGTCHYCQGMNYIVACMLMSFSTVLRDTLRFNAISQDDSQTAKRSQYKTYHDKNLQFGEHSRSRSTAYSIPANKRPPQRNYSLGGATSSSTKNTSHAKRQSMSFEQAWQHRILRADVEERCFWLLATLLEEYKVGSLYCCKSRTLVECLSRFERTAYQIVPDLMRFLKMHNVLPVMYAMEWFTTLFAYSMSSSTVWQIWDLLILQGFDTLHLIGIAVLVNIKEDLMTGHPEKILEILRKSTMKITGAQIRNICLKLAKDPPKCDELYSKSETNIKKAEARCVNVKRKNRTLFVSVIPSM